LGAAREMTLEAALSRLGWLVECVPRLSGEGEPYDARKTRFLARLYGGAPVLPVRVGIEMDSWVLRGR